MELNRVFYRNEILKIINQDRSDITLKRTVVSDDGYGGTTETEVVDILISGRFYNKSFSGFVVEISGDVPKSGQVASLKILTLGDTDIKEKDELTHEGTNYRVRLIKNYFDICKQCELEVISSES